ncbi:MAG: hypothetical protein RBR28_14250 [Lentimicrobium sp.]|jgi:hypothetical protein|nr:hypothetical protein [Lentimicrobium sp.]
MIKKSKQFLAEIQIAIGKLLEEGQEKVTLPQPFDGFTVQLEVDQKYPGEPLEFKDFGQEKDGYFFLVVTKL